MRCTMTWLRLFRGLLWICCCSFVVCFQTLKSASLGAIGTRLSFADVPPYSNVENHLNANDEEGRAPSLKRKSGVNKTPHYSDSTRRVLLASLATSVPLLTMASTSDASSPDLWWTTDPVNKRSGITISDAEKDGYNISFITYLSRFLLNFDKDCQRWWFAQSKQLPLSAKAQEIDRIRLDQFGAFSASVEVGLQSYSGKQGPEQLLASMLKRYCSTLETLQDTNSSTVPAQNNESANRQKERRRQEKEARRQIAILFGLLDQGKQPVKSITKLLAAIDNGSIESVKVTNPIDGYAATDDTPSVVFPPPQAGSSYESALGRAVMAPTGKLLRVDVTAVSDKTFLEAPIVSVSPPRRNEGATAVVKATLFKSGISKGRIERIVVAYPGSGYSFDDNIRVKIVGDDKISLNPILETCVKDVEILEAGSGYAVEKPLSITINDPSGKKKIVVGVANPRAEKDSYTTFRRESDTQKIQEFEQDLARKFAYEPTRVSGTVSGPDNSLPPRPFWGGASSSSQLLDLIPAGVGLEYDSRAKMYNLAVDTQFKNAYPAFLLPSSNRPLDPEFGPRGRSPIERNMELGLPTYLRFAASGAVCASGVHLALTPIDVAKTKMQTNPEKYPSIGTSFATIRREEGFATFFTGWVPTVSGNFLTGGILYAVTELVRRSLTETAGSNAASLEVPIILVAAATASFLGSFIMCPFEAVRIRSVAQPDYASNVGGVLSRMVKEEGAVSLINAIPVFLVKNIPYAMAKFTIFDLSTEQLYDALPSAHDDLKLSLAITLVGGILGGFGAAIISNPADAVISEMKKDKSKKSPKQALDIMLERAGVSSLFKGLPLRMVFYSLVASLQFLVYDSVRFALGVGSDDLRLYLDVLGGALRDS